MDLLFSSELVLLAPLPVIVLIGAYFFSKRKKNKIISPTEKSFGDSHVDSNAKVSVTDGQKNESQYLDTDIENTVAQALSKTSDSFFGRIKKALSGSNQSQALDEIEEILYTSDLGPKTVEMLLEAVRSELKSSELNNIEKIKSILYNELESILKPVHEDQTVTDVLKLFNHLQQGPHVIMVVGVNGAGKTTTIGKLTAQLASEGKKVLVAAGDTFRAAAGGQLKGWTERAQNQLSQSNNNSELQGEVDIFWPEKATDPAAVAFDAVSKGKAQGFDYVIVDTAGRLHTQVHLMEELKKVKRVMMKVLPEAPHDTWIVLDANSGQNALLQAQEYHKALDISGIVMTKMDGTAKGGVLVGVVNLIGKPVKLIGIGEKVKDLKIFNYKDYLSSILN